MGSFYPINPYQLMSEASNVRGGDNPPFTKDDFCYGAEPFFKGFAGLLPDHILDQFIAMAHSVVKESRWHEQWRFGMALYVAHMATLYIQSTTCDDATANQVISAAQAKGLQTSKSVGSVSVSYSFDGLTTEGWEGFQSTQYGRQFAAFAKLLGKAGMYVW